MPLLSDVFVIFLGSNVILTPNGQFLDCAPIAFREPHFLIFTSFQAWSIFIAGCSVVMSQAATFRYTSTVCHSTDTVLGWRLRVTFRSEILCRVLLRRHFGSERYVVELDFWHEPSHKLINMGSIRSLYKTRGLGFLNSVHLMGDI